MDNNYTHIAIVLDESGSMEAIKNATIKGYNSFVKENNTIPGKITGSLTKLGSRVHLPKQFDLFEFTLLDHANYKPSGTTPLYDAICQTIDATGEFLSSLPEFSRPGRIIFIIVTDGEENSSKEFNRSDAFAKIKHQQEHYKWEFVFMGANQDAYAVGVSLGIPQSNSLTYGYNARDTNKAWTGMTVNSMSYRTGRTTGMAFMDEQREEQKGGDAS